MARFDLSDVEWRVAEAGAIVVEAKYPPIGRRGIAGAGMHTGYRSNGARHATEYAPWANDTRERKKPDSRH